MNNSLALDFLKISQMGAISASHTAGFGDKKQADHAAVVMIRKMMNELECQGEIVIGEGERDEAPMLFIGEKIGTGKGEKVDIAIDPLENTNATAVMGNGAICVMAISERGGLFHAPDMYMDKLVVPEEAKAKVSLDYPAPKNLTAIARALGRRIGDLVVVILDRDRNEKLIQSVREAGARVKLVQDGDLMPAVETCLRGSGVHAVMGIGAAPETVISAAALKTLKGGLQARFWPRSEEEKQRLQKMGGKIDKIYTEQDLASGKNVTFIATGVTSGAVLKGVNFFGSGARTNSILISSSGNTINFIDSIHTFDHKTIKYKLK